MRSRSFQPKPSPVFAPSRFLSAITEKRPWVDDVGAAVPKACVDEFNQIYEDRKIVGAYHEPDGTLVCSSNRARNEVLRARGLQDNDACYRQVADY